MKRFKLSIHVFGSWSDSELDSLTNSRFILNKIGNLPVYSGRLECTFAEIHSNHPGVLMHYFGVTGISGSKL